MKRKLNLVIIALVVFAFSNTQFAQIKLDTGYNASNLSYYNVNQKDDYWIKKKQLGTAVSLQSDVITPNSAWKTDLSPAKWINAYPTNVNSQNGEYEFERCFCLKRGFSDAALSINLRADDFAEVLFNGNQILQTAATYSFNLPKPSSVDIKGEKYFRPGKNCLTVKLKNLYGVASGFILSGQVTAIGLDGSASGDKQTFPECSACSGKEGSTKDQVEEEKKDKRDRIQIKPTRNGPQ